MARPFAARGRRGALTGLGQSGGDTEKHAKTRKNFNGAGTQTQRRPGRHSKSLKYNWLLINWPANGIPPTPLKPFDYGQFANFDLRAVQGVNHFPEPAVDLFQFPIARLRWRNRVRYSGGRNGSGDAESPGRFRKQ